MTQFSAETNGLDLYADCLWWCGINVASYPVTASTSYPIKDFTRNANFALDRVTTLIMKYDRAWAWDDSNQSDLPIATTSLVANQRDYSIAVTHLNILRVRIKDRNGDWFTLNKVRREDLSDSELTESDGVPRGYDPIGNSFLLYPAPDYASSAGFEIQFQRPASYFASTDTTKVPGFNSQFHRLISLYPARDYLIGKDSQNRLNRVDLEIAKLEQELQVFYGTRNEERPSNLSMAGVDPR